MNNKAINEQSSLVHQLGEVEALIEVCRNHSEFQTSIEGVAIGGVLMIAVNKLSELHEVHSAKLEEMKQQYGEVQS